jgi:molybdopterin converting factor subunit 1
MIRVLFFARLREQLGESAIEVEDADAGDTVATLLSHLKRRDPSFADALGAENILCAVNQVQAAPDHAIAGGDEVAFFPPVTGG